MKTADKMRRLRSEMVIPAVDSGEIRGVISGSELVHFSSLKERGIKFTRADFLAGIIESGLARQVPGRPYQSKTTHVRNMQVSQMEIISGGKFEHSSIFLAEIGQIDISKTDLKRKARNILVFEKKPKKIKS